MGINDVYVSHLVFFSLFAIVDQMTNKFLDFKHRKFAYWSTFEIETSNFINPYDFCCYSLMEINVEFLKKIIF